MLIDLEIRDFAIIDDLSVQFGPGLNALTGETGAGKSILIDALGAVLGERTSPEMVRSSARAAFVDARFQLDELCQSPQLEQLLLENGIDVRDGELVLSREIQTGGRSSARVNGRVVTAALLGSIGQHLVDIHGQSDHLSLLRPTAQLMILDRFAHLDDQRMALGNLVREWRAIQSRLEAIDSGAREQVRRIDLMQFQLGEIDDAGLVENEDADLEAERARLLNADRLGALIATAANLINGESSQPVATSAADALRNANRSLADAVALDPSLALIGERLNESALLVEEIAISLKDYLDELEANPERLAWVLERLELIKSLKRKYGETIADILAFREEVGRELESLGGREHDQEALRALVSDMAIRVKLAASELTQSRKVAATELARDASNAAASLNLGNMMFSIDVRPRGDSNPIDFSGADLVEFLFAPNSGETAKSLARVASGGETARMMLALKSVLADSDHTPTLVFDEVDVGIGGRSGQVIGLKLFDLAGSHQVIAITHLPQIAALAHQHFKIRKESLNGRTISRVSALEGADRIDELAAMIDGEPPSATSRKAAIEMLARSNG